MANGLGYAAGEGAGAFKSALYPTLHYKIAMAQQQMETGMQAEKLRMDQESAALENEKTRLATEQAKFALETSKYNLEQTKQIEKDIDTAAEAMAPKPSVAGTGVKAIRAGRKASLPGIERLGKERAGQRAMTRIGLRKAPGQVLFPKEPKERSFADRINELEYNVLRNPSAYGDELKVWAKLKQEPETTKRLTSTEINQVWTDLETFLGTDRFKDLPTGELTKEINAFGHQRYPERWIDYPAPAINKVVRRFRSDLEIPTFVPEIPADLQEFFE